MSPSIVDKINVPGVIVMITSIYILSMLGVCMMISGVVHMMHTIPMIPPLCYSVLDEGLHEDEDLVYVRRTTGENDKKAVTEPMECGISLANTMPMK